MSRPQKQSDTENVIDLGHTGKYYHIMLNMADDDLGPFEYRLLGHYRRVCGVNGTCTQGVRKIAKTCQMSVGMVTKTREALVAGGWIHAEKRDSDNGFNVTLIDRMRENVERYADKAKGVHVVNTPVHVVNGGVHEVNERINNNKKEQEIVANATPPVKKAKPAKKDKPADPDNEAIKELIHAWKLASGTIDPAAFGKKVYRDSAREMHHRGITPEDVTVFTTLKCQQDAFWKGKSIPFSTIAKDISAWKAVYVKQPETRNASDFGAPNWQPDFWDTFDGKVGA